MGKLLDTYLYTFIIIVLIFQAKNVCSQEKATPLFDMDEIRDETTLGIEVIEDWQLVEGEVVTRQKLVTISVGELWKGQEYRVPVKMIVPAHQKAIGFHLTGGHMPKEIQRDISLKPFENELIKGGVGLVYTLVQTPDLFEQKELGDEMDKRFIETLNPHFSIQYWGWPATIMRAVTTAYSEKGYFGRGKVAVSGGSKNGASPSVALIADDRITAQHAHVSPIWDSPLRLCEKDAWQQLEKENERYAKELENQPGKLKMANIGNHFFLGGTFGPIYTNAALKAGHSWEDIQRLAEIMADYIFISRNLVKLKERNVDLLFHPGTHDFVNFDIQWGGAHFPQIPIYLKANTGHGKNEGHPSSEKDVQNLQAFLMLHFFEDMKPMLEPPMLNYEIMGNKLTVSVRFKSGSEEESGRIWWMFDRYPEGSAAYLVELFPDENWKDMSYDKRDSVWIASIELPENKTHIDFFSTHGKKLQRKKTTYQTHISSPYTRVKIKK